MSDPRGTIVLEMGEIASVVTLDAWRRHRDASGPGEERLDRAVDRLERVLVTRGWDRLAPDWVLTELLAIQGCLSLGLLQAAVLRTERLADRAEPRRARR
ncbi:MAG TPA: hypothetical protein VG709_07250 [Actinomycetota bacterium]|nr:hypothetical protein [Actinomycetota bacterium]